MALLTKSFSLHCLGLLYLIALPEMSASMAYTAPTYTTAPMTMAAPTTMAYAAPSYGTVPMTMAAPTTMAYAAPAYETAPLTNAAPTTMTMAAPTYSYAAQSPISSSFVAAPTPM